MEVVRSSDIFDGHGRHRWYHHEMQNPVLGSAIRMYDVTFWDEVISRIRVTYYFDVVLNGHNFCGEKVGVLRHDSNRTVWTCKVKKDSGDFKETTKNDFDNLEAQVYNQLGIDDWLTPEWNARVISMVRDVRRRMPGQVNLPRHDSALALAF